MSTQRCSFRFRPSTSQADRILLGCRLCLVIGRHASRRGSSINACSFEKSLAADFYWKACDCESRAGVSHRIAVAQPGKSIVILYSTVHGPLATSLVGWVRRQGVVRSQCGIVFRRARTQVKMYRAAYARTMTGIKGSIFAGR